MKITELVAKETGLTLDDFKEPRFFFDQKPIDVFANLMNKKQYNKMCSDIDKKTIKTKNYSIFAWNDTSGYDYWKRQGEVGDSNYIMIEVNIKNFNDLDIKELMKNVHELYDYFLKYQNVEAYYVSRQA